MPSKRKKRQSLFVTFEGIDGCGKSTQLSKAGDLLDSLGYKVARLREPGSTPTAERIREILLDRNSSITDITELLLYEAARSEIVSREIGPLLKSGYIVLCDRFYDSTTAYQGYGRGLDIRMVKRLHRVATGDCIPDLTLVFDVSLKMARSRLGRSRDRLESQSKAFFSRVRNGFLQIAKTESRRVKVIDSSRPVDEVSADVEKLILRKLR